MRINVYAEEITHEVTYVTKVVDAGTENERTFYGIRMYLASPDVLHYSPSDDDRSAITFWVPWTKADGHDFAAIEALFLALHDKTAEAHNENFRKFVQERERKTAMAPGTTTHEPETTKEPVHV